MEIDFTRIENILRNARFSFLLEHEVYALLNAAGISTPGFFFWEDKTFLQESDLRSLHSKNVVIKVVSPLIQHKSDVGGVRFAANRITAVKQTVADMRKEIPLRWKEVNIPGPVEGEESPSSEGGVEESILGFLICEAVDYEEIGFGSELLLGIRSSREFGPVLTLGSGGLDVEYMAERIREGHAVAISAAHLSGKDTISRQIEQLAVYAKLTQPFRGRPALISSAVLVDVCRRFKELAARFSPLSQESEFVIEEAEVNPLVIQGGRMIALDGFCRFSREHHSRTSRPFPLIRHLLHPQNIGIIGVSEKMNIGHIILNKILAQGFSRDQVVVIKPGKKEIEGCACVDAIEKLPEAVDLFVLTVSAEQSFSILKILIEKRLARSVIIIAGGIGEKEGTESLESDIKTILNEGRRRGLPVPVVNGGNCLGVFSRPGRFDTTFVPEHKLYSLPRKQVKPAPLVFISQSGAFMISRMSRMPGLSPRYAVSIGNQIDLTISDYLNHLASDRGSRIFAIYIEGFHDSDGLEFARAARKITRRPGKAVIVYKAGRSPEGRAATAGHTASVAGDYPVCRAVLSEAGVILADTVFEFENLVKGFCMLRDKKVRGRHVGLISNAGFECVIMSDSLGDEEALSLASFSLKTQRKLNEILAPLGIDRLQDVRNPLDITPVADDETFCSAVEVILADDSVDCAVVSPLPMTQAMRTLAPAAHHREDFRQEGSTARRLIDIFHRMDTPFVICLDAGENYQPMADYLERAGIPVFRRSDDAVRFLRRFVFCRLARV